MNPFIRHEKHFCITSGKQQRHAWVDINLTRRQQFKYFLFNHILFLFLLFILFGSSIRHWTFVGGLQKNIARGGTLYKIKGAKRPSYRCVTIRQREYALVILGIHEHISIIFKIDHLFICLPV